MTLPLNVSAPEDIYIPIIGAFALNASVFLIASLIKDNSIADIAWGALFVIPNWLLILKNNNWNTRTILVLSLLTIWGSRLSYHIFMRHKEEDYRYQ